PTQATTPITARRMPTAALVMAEAREMEGIRATGATPAMATVEMEGRGTGGVTLMGGAVGAGGAVRGGAPEVIPEETRAGTAMEGAEMEATAAGTEAAEILNQISSKSSCRAAKSAATSFILTGSPSEYFFLVRWPTSAYSFCE